MAKKICFVATTSATIRSFILPIALELAGLGVDVTIVCSNDDGMRSICESNGVSYYPVYMERGVNVKSFKAIKQLKNFFLKSGFAVVQYCTPNAAFYTSIAAKQAKVPTRLYCQWGIRYVGFSGIRRKVFKFIEKIVCSFSTDIRAVSWKNRDFAISEGLYKSEKVHVVGNGGTIGVDMSIFDLAKKPALQNEIRKKYGIPQDGFVFGFCGRLSRDKGSNELLTAFKNINEGITTAWLLIVGDIEGQAGIDESLFKWAKESERVIFTEKVPENEVYQYYTAMDILVHPTYREGFGMVIQEAGAYGIPCITTKIPGASEVMVDGESCILVEEKNGDELEQAMRKTFIDPELVKCLGGAAYERTKKLYDRVIMLRHQTEDYMNLLKNE